MKKATLGLIAGAFSVLAITGSRPAQAEPSLDQIVRTGYDSTAALDSGATLIGSFQFLFKKTAPEATAAAAFAGDATNSVYGWYDPSNNTVLNQIGTDTDGTPHAFDPSNPFALYLTDNNNGNTFYSQPGLNPDAPTEHMLIYQGSAANTYYVGYEDLPLVQSDLDYNDLVVKYTGVTLEPIPEPAFYQMGVLLAGGGLMAVRLRRRSK